MKPRRRHVALLLSAGVRSRVGAIGGVDRRRGDIREVAAVLFEVRVLRTREAVSRLVLLLLLLIDLRIVRSDGRFRSLTAIAAGFVIGTGILAAVVPRGVAGALLSEV